MDHRNTFDAMDRTLRDILRFNDLNSSDKIFGGKITLLRCDFRQALPVVPRGRKEDIVTASVNRSYV